MLHSLPAFAHEGQGTRVNQTFQMLRESGLENAVKFEGFSLKIGAEIFWDSAQYGSST